MRSKSQSTVRVSWWGGGSVRKAFAKKGGDGVEEGRPFHLLPRLSGDLCCCGNKLTAVPDGLELLRNRNLRLREGEVVLKWIFLMLVLH